MPERLHAAIVMMPDASGQFMRHQHFAAGPPRTGEPDKENVPILARFSNTTTVCSYWGGRFRASNGYAWGQPLEWAYITWAPVEDVVYNDAEGGGYLPESKGEWLYDTMRIIAKHHKILDVRNVMDMIPWPNDVEGEPEVS